MTSCFESESVCFRRMQMADLQLMYRWMNDDPLVRDTWTDGRGRSLEEIELKYGPRVRGDAPTRPYIITCSGLPIGYIQSYRWRDYPEYAKYLGLNEESASLDLFIGEAQYRHRGLGPRVLRQFLESFVFADSGVESCVITPEERNLVAIRAYEKAGFAHLRTADIPGEPGPIYLMRLAREGTNRHPERP